MMDTVTLANKSYQLVKKDFQIEEELILDREENAFDRLEEYLIGEINRLLDKDMGKLLNILYRIDIQESIVRQILHESPPGTIATHLAKAVIVREKQKVITRLANQP